MKSGRKNPIFKLIRFMPIILCVMFMALYFIFKDKITVEFISGFAPENIILAILFMLLLYAVKSLSIMFPFVILNMVGGLLFPTGLAVIVNFLGLIVELIVPYWVGRITGGDMAAHLSEKHPKLSEIINGHNGDNYFMAFFLRVINCLPTDAVSMYYGAAKFPFGIFLVCSFFGCMPLVLAVTLLGASITDISSPMFIISVILTVSISLSSIIIYRLWKKRRNKINNSESGD